MVGSRKQTQEEQAVTTPPSEATYPYHPAAWQEICDLGDIPLAGVEPAEGTDFVAAIWVQSMYGFACRLERPYPEPDTNTVNTFWFEKDDAGNRRFPHEGEPFILRGLRHPVARNPRKYGKFLFSKEEGLLEEPEGEQPDLYIGTIGKVKDLNDPELRIKGFEELLKTMLRAAARKHKPIPLPDYNKHLY